jgi:hypothetical protein
MTILPVTKSKNDCVVGRTIKEIKKTKEKKYEEKTVKKNPNKKLEKSTPNWIASYCD